ncbi:MAG: sensor histidine kinase, partial [Beijerinckiaceae bacterium]
VERQAITELERHIRFLSAHVGFDGAGSLGVDQLPSDPRFFTPYDGLYWQIESVESGILRSRSLWDATLAIPPAFRSEREPAEFSIQGPNSTSLLAIVHTLQIKTGLHAVELKVLAALDRRQLNGMRNDFLRLLVPALMVLGLVLLLALIVFIKIGLSPFRDLRHQIEALHSGRTRAIQGIFPGEVQPLVAELNGFISTQDKMLTTARHQAADLVHGLKTPVAVLQAIARSLGDRHEDEMANAVTVQTDLLERQVRRALARTRAGITSASSHRNVLLAPVLERLVNTMRVLGGDKPKDWNLNLDPALNAPGDDIDMMELFGNILDNARQWARSRVDVEMRPCTEGILVSISDDGPGLPETHLHLPARGFRLDQGQGGAGFGIAISRDIAEAYRGSLVLARSSLGGLAVTISLPQSSAVQK